MITKKQCKRKIKELEEKNKSLEVSLRLLKNTCIFYMDEIDFQVNKNKELQKRIDSDDKNLKDFQRALLSYDENKVEATNYQQVICQNKFFASELKKLKKEKNLKKVLLQFVEDKA